MVVYIQTPGFLTKTKPGNSAAVSKYPHVPTLTELTWFVGRLFRSSLAG